MKRWFVGLALSCLAGALPAAHAETQPHDFRASLLVNGTISVSDAGTVTGYSLDQPGKLPGVVVDMLQRSIPTWRFHPAVHGGHPVAVTATMHARLVATPVGDHRFRIRLAGTSFEDGLPRTGEIRLGHPHAKPIYPIQARMEHASGTAYVIARINRQGRVTRAAVAEVDLMNRGGPAVMAHARKLFAHAALRAARTWHFTIPSVGPKARDDHWDVRIPVTFRIAKRGHDGKPPYGQWQPYIPGPRRYIPWMPKHELTGAIAQPGDSVQMLGGGLYRIDPHGS